MTGRVLITVLALGILGCGPLGPLAGGRLSGEVRGAAPADWAQVAAIETIQLETNPEDPHSINAWCGTYEGGLYVPTSLILGAEVPTEREWVRNVLADPRVRLRADGVVYELQATRVEDPAEFAGARKALLEKYDVELDEHASAAWVFRLENR